MEREQLPFPIITFTILILFMVLWKWKKSRTSSNKVTAKLPPGPWKLPVIGNLHQLVGYLPHRRFSDLAKKYGPIMHIQLGEISTVVISSAELAREVIKTHDLSFADRPFNLAASIIAYNSMDIAFSPYGDYWKQVKKICVQELLSAQRVRSFKLIREEEVSKVVRSIRSSSDGSVPINLSKMIWPCAISIAFKSAFGKHSKHEDAFIPLITKILRLFGGFRVPDVFPSVRFLQSVTGMKRKLIRLHQETDTILEKIISEYTLRKTTTNYEFNNEEINLIDVLLNLKDRGNLEFPFTADNMKAVILDMFLGGTEPPSAIVEWTISELLRHPELMEKAQTEVRKVYTGKENIDESSLQDLKYLKLVVKETLRLHMPEALIAPRAARRQVQISGYDIPTRTVIHINAWAIGRDPKYWKEPDRFYPERFLNSSIDYKGTNYEYIPFGGGRRICPGIHQGIAMVEIILANLLYHFNWKLPNEMKPEDLDMSEEFGFIVEKKNPLYVIPIPYLDM